MNISNYRTETERIKREYEVAIKSTPSVMKVFNDKVTKAIMELIALEVDNPALASDIKKCRVELEKKQNDLTKAVNKDNSKGNGKNFISGARKAFGLAQRIHKAGEAPVDAIKRGMGL